MELSKKKQKKHFFRVALEKTHSSVLLLRFSVRQDDHNIRRAFAGGRDLGRLAHDGRVGVRTPDGVLVEMEVVLPILEAAPWVL